MEPACTATAHSDGNIHIQVSEKFREDLNTEVGPDIIVICIIYFLE